jgi:hypothetical protein
MIHEVPGCIDLAQLQRTMWVMHRAPAGRIGGQELKSPRSGLASAMIGTTITHSILSPLGLFRRDGNESRPVTWASCCPNVMADAIAAANIEDG